MQSITDALSSRLTAEREIILQATTCPAPKGTNSNSLNSNSFIKGEYKGIIFIKFACRKDRDYAVENLIKANLNHSSQKIWVTSDRPIRLRCQLSCLFGIKRLLSSWQFSKASLWVDENDMTLYWNGDIVASTCIMNDRLQCSFGNGWKDYLMQGNIEEIYVKANESLQRSLIAQGKGKGKGKQNTEVQSSRVFGIHPSEY